MGRRVNLETRERILETAYRLFHNTGYYMTSMEDVAKAAGIKKANLFHYYPRKDDLGSAVIERLGERFKEKIKRQLGKGEGDPVQTLDQMFLDNEERMKSNRCCKGCFYGNLAQEVSDHNDVLRSRVSEIFQFWSLHLSAFLEDAKRNRLLKKDLPAEEVAEALLCLMEGALLLSKARKQTSALASARKMMQICFSQYRV